MTFWQSVDITDSNDDCWLWKGCSLSAIEHIKYGRCWAWV